MRTGACPQCGATDWGTRNRCNNCRALAAQAARRTATEDWRAQERARMNAWRRANPEKTKAQSLRAHYGMTTADFNVLLVQQEGLCAVCKVSAVECVDHCHETGKVRGILCRPCNVALGQFQDDPALLLAAARYLEAAE